MTSARRTRCPSSPAAADRSSTVRSGPESENRTSGWAIASRRTTSLIAEDSARSDLRNFNRAGVAKKRSRTSMRVPSPSAAGVTGPTRPPSTAMLQASAAPRRREVTVSRAAAPMAASASPRKPRERISSRPPSSLEVQWRSTARARSSRAMPSPSSLTRISVAPPPAVAISIRRAPASIAFSTSSLTTLAGRSTTSPAAMRLTMSSLRRRIGIVSFLRARTLADSPRRWKKKASGARQPRRAPLVQVLAVRMARQPLATPLAGPSLPGMVAQPPFSM